MNATDRHDPRTTATATITWSEDRKSGRGFFTAQFDDDSCHAVPEEWATQTGPITAASDSDSIAAAVASDLGFDVLSVEHDGEYIFATMRQR